MSKKTLTDELQSVMLAHSFDAPEPTATIDEVLARTVSATGSDLQVTRRRWFPSPKLIGVAASVALLVVGAVALSSGRHSQSRTSSSAESNASGDAKAALGAPENSAPFRGPSDDTRIQAPAGVLPVRCAAPGSTIGGTSTDVAQTGSPTGPIRISESYCVDQHGHRLGGEVRVYRVVNGSAQVVATLIRPQQNLYLFTASYDGKNLVIRAFDPRTGTVSDYPFATSDGKEFAAGRPTLYAARCTIADLAVELRDGPVLPSPSPAATLLQFRNRSAKPCTIAGFPIVQVIAGNGQSVRTITTMFGERGGVRGNLGPILVLEPGTAATAILEYPEKSAPSSACPKATSLQISPPSGSGSTSLPFTKSICGGTLEVHPIVSGLSGSN
jgi:hypothetical protein